MRDICLWCMDLRSQTLCHSVSRVLIHSLRASWVASIHTRVVLATKLQPTASSSAHRGTFKRANTPPRGPPFIWVVTVEVIPERLLMMMMMTQLCSLPQVVHPFRE